MTLFARGEIETRRSDRIIQRMKRKLIHCCVMAAGVLAMALPAMGVDNNVIPEREKAVPWLGIGFAVLCLALICVVAFLNAKRTHLD